MKVKLQNEEMNKGTVEPCVKVKSCSVFTRVKGCSCQFDLYLLLFVRNSYGLRFFIPQQLPAFAYLSQIFNCQSVNGHCHFTFLSEWVFFSSCILYFFVLPTEGARQYLQGTSLPKTIVILGPDINPASGIQLVI